eukprot:TRINITY_DN14927_c0_g1_i1.p1 TRINITY_DN14927_c0_g1~~TRINITY_DN14927_c0_g1_i1.p1  ORF type:complete len:150 (+),score=8.36 TRINITY_DN14927_c0_g1_i1:88-537(+)
MTDMGCDADAHLHRLRSPRKGRHRKRWRAPLPADVPIPTFHERESQHDKAVRLAVECGPEVQLLLQDMALTLLKRPNKVASESYAMYLCALEKTFEWMQEEGLRLSEILRCFPDDFALSSTPEDIFVKYRHGFVKTRYSCSVDDTGNDT